MIISNRSKVKFLIKSILQSMALMLMMIHDVSYILVYIVIVLTNVVLHTLLIPFNLIFDDDESVYDALMIILMYCTMLLCFTNGVHKLIKICAEINNNLNLVLVRMKLLMYVSLTCIYYNKFIDNTFRFTSLFLHNLWHIVKKIHISIGWVHSGICFFSSAYETV